MKPEPFCPHLGSVSDPEIRYLFPHSAHICLHTELHGQIAIEHQEDFCLSENHPQCPLFENPASEALPEYIYPQTGTSDTNAPKLPLLVILLVLIIGGAIAIWSVFFRQTEQLEPKLAVSQVTLTATLTLEVSPQASLTPTSSPSPTQTAVPTQMATSTPEPSQTPIPSETPTSPPTPGPGLGTPIGNYVLHRVKTGESISSIATLYQTSIDKIRAVNVFQEGRGIWIGDILIIPVSDQISDETRFQYLFVEKKTTLEAVAQEYDVSIEDLRIYNLLGDIDWIPAGRWLIIPVADE